MRAVLLAPLAAGSFAVSLGMIFPAIQLLLGERKSLSQLLQDLAAHRLTPEWTGEWLQEFIPRLPRDPFWSFAMVMVGITGFSVFTGLVTCLHQLNLLKTSLRLSRQWRQRLFKHLLQLPMAQVLRLGSSESISRLVSDTQALAQAYQAAFGRMSNELLRGAAAVLVALILEWRLTLVSLVCAPLVFGVLHRCGEATRQAFRRALEGRAHLLKAACWSLQNVQVVKVHTGEQCEQERFRRVNEMAYRQEVNIGRTQTIGTHVFETVSVLLVVGLATTAAWYVLRRGVEPARFMMTLVALFTAAQSLRFLAALTHELNHVGVAISRLQEILDLPVECGPENNEVDLIRPRHHQNIAFEDVSYSYPDRELAAIRHVSFTVAFGSTVTIIGPNGSGKTTLLSLLPRLLIPTSGRVLIDGVDIAQLNLRDLRAQMAVVPQEPILFEGSIAENLTYGLPPAQASPEKIEAAARTAHAHEFILTLPDGYHTRLGECGAGLSAGQKQRLALARALLRRPAILLLDEPTSQVDPESACRIRESLSQLRGQCTAFIVTHHFDAFPDVDLIVVMNQGRVLHVGSHGHLSERSQLYRAYAGSQAQTKPVLI